LIKKTNFTLITVTKTNGMEDVNKDKPVCYDPSRKKFIYYDEITSGKENIIPLDTLSEDDIKKLVIERQKAGPDYRVQAISGPPYSRDEVIQAIEQNDPFGLVTVAAEISYLKGLLISLGKNRDKTV
jgi:hypothetical protein